MEFRLPLREYLEKREEELIRERHKLGDELDEVRAARAAIEDHNRKFKQPSRLTIKDMVRSVLTSHRDGGTSDQIVDWINNFFDSEVARSSLSPQLSRLKSDGVVSLDDDTGIWSLTNRADIPFEMRDKMKSRLLSRTESTTRPERANQHFSYKGKGGRTRNREPE